MSARATVAPPNYDDRESNVRHVTRLDAVQALQNRLARFERIYEMSSEEMVTAVRTGRIRETAEVAQWLVKYRALKHLSH